MQGTLRNPRAVLTIGGAVIALESAEISLSTNASSDTAHVDFPLNHPDFDPSILDGSDIPMVIEITGDGAGGGLLFTGTVTQDTMTFHTGICSVQGEDKTASLLKKKSVESFKNKKGGEVADEIGKRHGLTVDTEGSTLKAGKQYQIDHVLNTDGSEWEVINQIAEREGLVASIDKTNATLSFKREDEDDLPVFPVRYSPPGPDGPADANAITIQVTKNHKIAGKTKVNVRSWNTREKKVITASKDGDGDGEATVYDYRIPNLSQEQADRIAEKKHGENTRHELGLTVDMPGDAGIPARSKIDLSGTGTARDQMYFTSTISHRIGFDEGWRMTITAKNKAAGKGKT